MSTNDPRNEPTQPYSTEAADTMRTYIDMLNKVQKVGMVGFANMIDTATPEELIALQDAARTINTSIARVLK